MMIDWVVITSKVPEVAMVLLFVWFTLKMLREFRSYLTEQNTNTAKHSKERDEAYLGKFKEVGNNQSKDMETVSKDIRTQTNVMTDICKQMETNDELLEFIANDVKTRQIRGD